MGDRPIIIIAEAGINHQGDMAIASELIYQAKRAGADIIKFQIYNPERLLDKEDPVLKPHWDTIVKTKLSKAQVHILKNECDRVGIEFMASAFRPETVGWLRELGVKRYKIASRSFYDEELAEAIAKTGGEVIISYGMAGDSDLPAIAEWIDYDDPQLKHLYCVSKYPTPLSDLQFYHEGECVFGLEFDGFSDHTVGVTASVVAMWLGATIIEKHFTLDRNLPGPDHVCSITPPELRQLCQMRDEIDEILP